MKVLTQAIHFKADSKLLDFIQKKLDKLELFYDRVIDAEVFLHVLNTSDKENKMVELKMRVPGETFMVKKTATSFEECIDLCADSMRRKLKAKNDRPKEAPSAQ